MISQQDYREDLGSCAEMRGGPGILILTGDGHVQYMNRRSWDLIRIINRSSSSVTRGLLPLEITDICRCILTQTDLKRSTPLPVSRLGSIRHLKPVDCLSLDRLEQSVADKSEIRQLVGGSDYPVLLRGLKLPGQDESESTHILIIMETAARREPAIHLAKERFQLTEREHSVVQGLAKGWTNKEIGAELRITEPTVKVHIRNIMDKTKCSTRTGIVALLLHA